MNLCSSSVPSRLPRHSESKYVSKSLNKNERYAAQTGADIPSGLRPCLSSFPPPPRCLGSSKSCFMCSVIYWAGDAVSRWKYLVYINETGAQCDLYPRFENATWSCPSSFVERLESQPLRLFVRVDDYHLRQTSISSTTARLLESKDWLDALGNM